MRWDTGGYDTLIVLLDSLRSVGAYRLIGINSLVLRSWCRQEIGQTLITAIEQAARQSGSQLLIFATRLNDAAERLYARMGYIRAGVIPKFALNSTGLLGATVIFYRNLST